MSKFIPDRGDIVWLTLDPQAGHEQRGRRPALTLSPKEYNKKTGLALFVPITNQKKGYPFEVDIPNGLKVSGVMLSDQAKSQDWIARKTEFICDIPDDTMQEVLDKLQTLIS